MSLVIDVPMTEAGRKGLLAKNFRELVTYLMTDGNDLAHGALFSSARR